MYRLRQNTVPTQAGTTGSLVIPAQPDNSAWNDGILVLTAHVNDPCGTLHGVIR